jgi:hypothetical protein
VRTLRAAPIARQRGLVVKAVGEEVLVYDLERYRAHRLNEAAAVVWRLSDGTRTTREVSLAAGREGVPLTRDAVRFALAELRHARFLAEPVGEGSSRDGN